MKKAAFALAIAVVFLCLAEGSSGAQASTSVSGKSGAFSIDTRTRNLVIEDVKSSFCSGVYGMNGACKATFLHGVKANVGFTVTMRGADVKPTRLLVRGKQYTGDRFELDVGTLRVGESLKVVAYGVVNGQEVESEPFRVNFDVARVPFPGWVGGVADALAGYAKDIAAGQSKLVATALSITWKRETTKRLPWWLPLERVDVAPSLALSAHYSLQSGTCIINIGKVGQNWSGGHMIRRSNGQFFKWGNKSWGWDAHGEVKMVWNPALLKWDWESAGITGTVQGELKNIVFNGAVGPVPVFVAPILKGAISPAVRIYGLGGLSDLELSATSRNFPTIGGRAGVGVYPAFAGYGLLSGSGDLDARFGGPKGNDLSFGLYATGGFGVAFFGFTPEITWDSDTFWLFGDKAEKAGAKGMRETEVEVKWVPMGRGYLEKKRRGSGFETGGYPNPAPAVATGKGGEWVAYLQDDGTRGDAERTELVVQQRSGGTWGKVEKVWDDGTADWMPSLGIWDKGTTVVAWANARKGTRGTSLEATAKGLELAVGIRNAGTGQWMAQNLTDDDSADFLPVVSTAGDGTAMVAWLRNAAGFLLGTPEAPTSVMASRWNGNAWSTPAEVAKAGAVSGLDLAYDGTNACVVWAYDGDGDWMTAGNMAVAASVWKGGKWGTPKTMVEELPGVTPILARIGTTGVPQCVWNADGTLMERSADGASAAMTASVGWDGLVPEDARAAHGADGMVGLVWTDGEDNEDNLATKPVAMIYDAEVGSWGGPVPLARKTVGKMARALSVSVNANEVLAAWESAAITTNSSGQTVFGTTELRVESVVAAANPGVRADGFAFATDHVVPGEVTGVNVTVCNTGLKSVSNVSLRVWVCDGMTETNAVARQELFGAGDKPIVLDLPGGAEIVATVRWLAVDSMSNLTFVARVEPPAGGSDTDISDNEVSWQPGMASLQLENARCEAVGNTLRLLTATVQNTGLAGAEAGTTVSFRLESTDGRELGRDVAGSLQAGSAHGYDAGIAWDMAGGTWTESWVMVYAMFDTGDAESDASSALPIRVMTPRDRDGDGLLDGEEEAMGTDPLKTDTNGDGTNDYEHVYVYFSDPLAGMESAYTTTTPVPVPYAWLDGYADALAAHAGDYEAFAWDLAANGTNQVWECYVAGMDPTDENEEFKAVLSFQNGKPLVEPRPDWRADESRAYRVEGKKSVGDNDWVDVTDMDDWDGEGWRVFRMRVEMAK